MSNIKNNPQNELKELREKYELARVIVTPDGFYQTWFASLPKHKSGAKAFEALNQQHYDIVKPPRLKYSSYQAFLTVIRRRKNQKN